MRYKDSVITKIKASPVKFILISAGIFFILSALLIFLLYTHFDLSKTTLQSIKNEILALGVWGPVIYIVFLSLRPFFLLPFGVYSALAGTIWGLKGLVYVLFGVILTATIEFFLARYFARDQVKKMIGTKFQRFNEMIKKRGFLTVFLVRLVPNLPWEIQNLAFGLTKVRFSDYIVATALGMIPGIFVSVYCGTSLTRVLADPSEIWKIVLLSLAFPAILFVLYKKKLI